MFNIEAKYRKQNKRKDIVWYKSRKSKNIMPIKRSIKSYRKVKNKFDKKYSEIMKRQNCMHKSYINIY